MTELSQKIPCHLHIECRDGILPEVRLNSLLGLHETIFSGQSRGELLAEMAYRQQRRLTTWLALDNDRVIGYKMGYERKPGHYYSWIGCVDATYRGQGIASELMTLQHNWCREQGYKTIRTQTYNQWRTMLILNIQHGFDIIGTQQGTHGLMIVLEKKL